MLGVPVEIAVYKGAREFCILGGQVSLNSTCICLLTIQPLQGFNVHLVNKSSTEVGFNWSLDKCNNAFCSTHGVVQKSDCSKLFCQIFSLVNYCLLMRYFGFYIFPRGNGRVYATPMKQCLLLFPIFLAVLLC